MTPEQLEEVPGIGEKTLERISVAVRHYFGQYEEGEVNPNAAAETSSEDAKATEVDEPGTPDEPVEEATAELKPESDPEAADTETMEVENAADAERTHPVEAEDTVPVADVSESPEEILEETEMAEEAAIDQDSETTEKKGDA
jgi:N utilization substance protein A